MKNDSNFDKTRSIELLKKQEILRNHGTSFFFENRKKKTLNCYLMVSF